MERLTKRVGPGQYTCGDGSAAIHRLGLYEDFLDQLLAERQAVLDHLAALRAQDKVKTATYRQLLAGKLTCQMLIDKVDRALGK